MKNLFAKTTLVLLLLISITTITQAQSSKAIRQMLTDQSFIMAGNMQEDFQLTKLDTTIHNDGVYGLYTFMEDGTFSYSLHNPNQIGLCGVGMTHIHNGTWNVKRKKLILEVSGEQFAIRTFKYKTKYKVNIEENTLEAYKKKVYYSETNEPYMGMK